MDKHLSSWRNFSQPGENDLFYKSGTVQNTIPDELERSFESKAHSEKSMNVSDMKVTDKDDFLSRSMIIKAKNIIMKERTWINRVAQRRISARCHKCETQWWMVVHGVERISLVPLPREACYDQKWWDDVCVPDEMRTPWKLHCWRLPRAHMWTSRNVRRWIQWEVAFVTESTQHVYVRKESEWLFIQMSKKWCRVNEFTDFDNQWVCVPVHRAISPTMCGVTWNMWELMDTVSSATPGLNNDLMWCCRKFTISTISMSVHAHLPVLSVRTTWDAFSHSHQTVHVLHGSRIPKSFGSVFISWYTDRCRYTWTPSRRTGQRTRTSKYAAQLHEHSDIAYWPERSKFTGKPDKSQSPSGQRKKAMIEKNNSQSGSCTFAERTCKKNVHTNFHLTEMR